MITMNFWKNKLPQDLERKIFSYLYFSDEKSIKIEILNDYIKNYNIIQLNYLNDKYDLLIVCYFMLKYFLYDKNNCEKLLLDYTMLSKDPLFQKSELNRIFMNLRLVDLLRLRKYIECNGATSDYYTY